MNLEQITILETKLAKQRLAVQNHFIYAYCMEKYQLTDRSMMADCKRYYTGEGMTFMRNPMHYEAECEFKALIAAMVETEQLIKLAKRGKDPVYTKLALD